MTIPGYDPDDIENAVKRVDDSAGARVDVVAGAIPDAFDVAASTGEPPAGAVSTPVDVTGLDELAGVETVRIALSYDPAALPADASPDDVTIVAAEPDDRRQLPTTVHRESETVSAELSREPPDETFVAVVDR